MFGTHACGAHLFQEHTWATGRKTRARQRHSSGLWEPGLVRWKCDCNERQGVETGQHFLKNKRNYLLRRHSAADLVTPHAHAHTTQGWLCPCAAQAVGARARKRTALHLGREHRLDLPRALDRDRFPAMLARGRKRVTSSPLPQRSSAMQFKIVRVRSRLRPSGSKAQACAQHTAAS